MLCATPKKLSSTCFPANTGAVLNNRLHVVCRTPFCKYKTTQYEIVRINVNSFVTILYFGSNWGLLKSSRQPYKQISPNWCWWYHGHRP